MSRWQEPCSSRSRGGEAIDLKTLLERLWELDRMSLKEAEELPLHSWGRSYFEAKSIGIRQAIRAAQNLQMVTVTAEAWDAEQKLKGHVQT